MCGSGGLDYPPCENLPPQALTVMLGQCEARSPSMSWHCSVGVNSSPGRGTGEEELGLVELPWSGGWLDRHQL